MDKRERVYKRLAQNIKFHHYQGDFIQIAGDENKADIVRFTALELIYFHTETFELELAETLVRLCESLAQGATSERIRSNTRNLQSQYEDICNDIRIESGERYTW